MAAMVKQYIDGVGDNWSEEKFHEHVEVLNKVYEHLGTKYDGLPQITFGFDEGHLYWEGNPPPRDGGDHTLKLSATFIGYYSY